MLIPTAKQLIKYKEKKQRCFYFRLRCFCFYVVVIFKIRHALLTGIKKSNYCYCYLNNNTKHKPIILKMYPKIVKVLIKKGYVVSMDEAFGECYIKIEVPQSNTNEQE